MQEYRHFFEGKRITLLGLGLLGRGVGDAEFLAHCGANIVVTDKKTEVELAESVARLKKYPNIEFHLGGHKIEDFITADMIIKAAGVQLNSPEIAAARAAGVPVYMSTALFTKYATDAGAKIVGVTGTRGKSTVAHMIFHVLKHTAPRQSSQPSPEATAGTAGRERKVFLGGNIRGKSTLSMLPEVQKGDICVLELDSWQLQGFGDLQISPRVAVITNLMLDHLNYYRGDMDAYFSDKANIFRFQKPGDVFIAGASVAERAHANALPLDPIIPESLPYAWKLKVLGEHNRENASFAATALQALGLSDDEIRESLESFEGVEGRLQLVREVGGVKIYNDNNATTPEAVVAALRALSDVRFRKPNIILIVGGADKGLDMSELVAEINKICKVVILLAGTGTSRLLEARSYKLEASTHGPYDSLDQTVHKALELAKPGDAVLFSPAFASFGMFKNEYDRNDQFLTLVDKLAP
ncbi:MAG: UDP-N-acetylmuramoylalanine-D-glutamate ligase [Candidatus Kaiserbacteria bacterium GW2011_GWC2_49_12]|uniref:UDP-N-acetylmuramoylalanine--D-glutamate ligase n=3 Tax=Candidatus Kaiseribacteriota TaxID=1752734 RepID=A0A0G1YRZ4_9BACT|nr:MAG: UDP-N-acetylmuramoylalanine-D-glutamate ligase [Candidatus Kaiserbacteria bacterium GW2011_GWC2_49_12]KKW17792.1 MAG: UDP-N-acetylmuramoylalanine-D-glutamate ligase [Candidatus Kaiserbacteria bacterium GW2011_GWB1_50_17]OGG87975.1 MAG: hypothetical protein A3H15_00685 [Candidatus Kaiserbacteria bacterium RIFCSPLOWO2_12_FULL_50_28]HCM43597.1 hypothetical protein [Candidatus Kaiserbacteria bacterium]